ncbi:MAG: DUF5791 family protein [Halobacteriaceae archaeon]
MLYEVIDDPAGTTPAAVRASYESALADVVDAVGAATVTAETGVDRERLDALVAGESPAVTVAEAAAILGCSADWPDAETVELEVRDHIMLQMSSAVLDVEAVETGLRDETDLDARTIQQKIEGRQPMTLDEYAAIHHFVASENPY